MNSTSSRPGYPVPSLAARNLGRPGGARSPSSPRGSRRARLGVEELEGRRLLSLAVLEILNKSTYTINFDFRWTPSSAWTAYTEAPGQGEILWTSDSSSLRPQALYDTTTSSGSQTTVNLAQGYGE
jgi:hypothetical protein